MTSLDPNTWFDRDPVDKALRSIRHAPDPKANGADVRAVVEELRATSSAPDDTFAKAADFLDYQQIVVARASRTVIKLGLAMALLVALIVGVLVAR